MSEGARSLAKAMLAASRRSVQHHGDKGIVVGAVRKAWPDLRIQPSTGGVALPDEALIWSRAAKALRQELSVGDTVMMTMVNGRYVVLDAPGGTGSDIGSGSGVSVHAELEGLLGDDHPQYALADGTRGDFASLGHGHTSADISDLTAFVNNLIAAVVDAAPASLDTLNELAAALNDDPNFATNIINQLAGKVSKLGDVIDGDLTIRNTGDATFHIEADTDNIDENHNPVLRLSQDGGLVNTYLGITGDNRSYIRTTNDAALGPNLFRTPDGTSYYKVWDEGNDGPGSGLDADTVDGIHGANIAGKEKATATITASGWYRIASNGPVANASTGGDRASARFMVMDTQSSQHSASVFHAGYNFHKANASVNLLHRTYYTSYGAIRKIRIVAGDVYEGAAVEVYVDIGGGASSTVQVVMMDDEHSSGWTLQAFTAGDVPTGHVAATLDMDAASGNNAVMMGMAAINNAGVAQNNAWRVFADGSMQIAGSDVVTEAGADFTGQVQVPSAFIVKPADGTNEGGEITLQGAGTYGNKNIDVYQNSLRVLHAGAPVVSWTHDPAGGGARRMYLNNKEAFMYHDTWLRINENNAFTAGTYFGGTVVRTDGSFQVGASGGEVLINSNGIVIGIDNTYTAPVKWYSQHTSVHPAMTPSVMIDATRFRSPQNVEYWDGASWVSWAGYPTAIDTLFSGRSVTPPPIDYDHRNFRFELPVNAWSFIAHWILQCSWGGLSTAFDFKVEYWNGSAWMEYVNQSFSVSDGIGVARPALGSHPAGSSLMRLTFNFTSLTAGQTANTIMSIQGMSIRPSAAIDGDLGMPFGWDKDRNLIHRGPDPTLADHLLPKGFADATYAAIGHTHTDKLSVSAYGASTFHSVKVLHTSNVNIAAPASATFDSTTVAVGDRVFLFSQTTAAQIGPWIFNGVGVPMTRPDDWANGATIRNGEIIVVEHGTYRGMGYRVTAQITVDTTSPTFERAWASNVLTETITGSKTFSGTTTTSGRLAVNGALDFGATATSTVTLTDGTSLSRQMVDNTAAVTITLPASPTSGRTYIIGDRSGNRANPITIARNGKLIDGIAADLTIDSPYGMYMLQYDGVGNWVVLSAPEIDNKADDGFAYYMGMF